MISISPNLKHSKFKFTYFSSIFVPETSESTKKINITFHFFSTHNSPLSGLSQTSLILTPEEVVKILERRLFCLMSMIVAPDGLTEPPETWIRPRHRWKWYCSAKVGKGKKGVSEKVSSIFRERHFEFRHIQIFQKSSHEWHVIQWLIWNEGLEEQVLPFEK